MFFKHIFLQSELPDPGNFPQINNSDLKRGTVDTICFAVSNLQATD